MSNTDREMDLFIVEIQEENARLIREYLEFVERKRARSQPAVPQEIPPAPAPAY